MNIPNAMLVLLLGVLTLPAFADQGPGLPTRTFSDNEEFRILSTIESPDGHGNVAMVNGYLMAIYSSDSGGESTNGGIEFWDISDPKRPVRAYRYDNDDTHGLREAHGFGFSSSYEIDGESADLMVAQAVDGIQIWDLTDPADITLLSYLDLPGVSQGDYTGAWWVFWQAPYVYVAGTSAGLLVVDATDPRNPAHSKTVTPIEISGARPAVVFAVGNMLVLASVNDGSRNKFVTMDISDPRNPLRLDTLDGQVGYSHIFAAGRIFVSGKETPPRMHVYTVGHDGTIAYESSGSRSDAVGNDLDKGGYGSYQDGYFFSGFSNKFAKFNAGTGRIVGTASTDRSGRDEDFGMVLGNLAWIGEDHGKGSGLMLHDSDPDTTPPDVEWMHPAPDSHGVSALSRIGFSMSDNIDPESLTTATFKVTPLGTSEAIEGHYSVQQGLINFAPHTPLASGTTYQVVLEGVRDWAGNPSPKYTAQFKTYAHHASHGEEEDPPVSLISPHARFGTVSLGMHAYSDAERLFWDVPTYLEGRTAILTPIDPPYGRAGGAYLSFEIAQDSIVYIISDSSSPPPWTRSSFWDRMDEEVVLRKPSDNTNSRRSVHRQTFRAGRVNLEYPRYRYVDVKWNYTVAIEPLPTSDIESFTPTDTVHKIRIGGPVYSTGDYTFVGLPEYLEGHDAIIPIDHRPRSDLWAKVPLDSSVFVLFDDQARSVPNWLRSYEKLGLVPVSGGEHPLHFLRVYKTDAIVLNERGYMRFGDARVDGVTLSYVVVVVPRSEELASLSTENDNYALEIRTIDNLSKAYLDESHRVSTLPPFLKNRQAIITANEDKRVSNPSYIEFTLPQPSAVFLAVDERFTPSWVTGSFVRGGGTFRIIRNSGDSVSFCVFNCNNLIAEMRLYMKVFPAGRVTLPGAEYDYGGSGRNHANYMAIIVPLEHGLPIEGLKGLGAPDGDGHVVAAPVLSGMRVYSDRSYTYGAALPAFLDGQTAIMTKNDFKHSRAANYIQFDLTEASDIYLLVREGSVTVPAWLDNEFTPVSDTVPIEGANANRTVFVRPARPGRISLGGPSAPRVWQATANYTVVVAPRAGAGVVTRLGNAYDAKLITLRPGSPAYVDRTYTFDTLPTYLVGQTAIVTANNDKFVTDDNYLDFELTEDADIYVLYDERADRIPDWLRDDYVPVIGRAGIEGEGSDDAEFAIKKRFMRAGPIRLPGPGAGAASGARANYAVVVVPNKGAPPVRVAGCELPEYLHPTEVGLPFPAPPARILDAEGVVEYSWNFGDGSDSGPFSTNLSAEHTYSDPGRHIIELSVRNRDGMTIRCAALKIAVNDIGTRRRPTRSASIVAERGREYAFVYTVNPDNDSVTAVRVSPNAPTRPEIAWEVAVGDRPTTLALLPDSGELWVANQGSGSIHILDSRTGALIQEISLGRGTQPFGVVASSDDQHVYVTTEAEGELYKFGVHNREIVLRTRRAISFDPESPPSLPRARGIALSGDSTTAYIGRFLSEGMEGSVYKVDTRDLSGVRIDLAKDPGPDDEDHGRGVPNYLNSLTISPDGGSLKVPSVKANVERGVFNDGQELTFETRVRTIVSHIDTQTGTEVLERRVDLGDRDSATAIAFSSPGDYYSLVMQGNNLLEIRDSVTDELIGQANTGAAPRDVAILENEYLFVHNYLGRSVSIYDIWGIRTGRLLDPQLVAEVDVVAEEALAPPVLAGKRIFYHADERMGRDGYISCASCHLDGGHDGFVWDFTQAGEGLRNTVSLHGRAGLGHGNVHWTANFDEIQDFENDIRNGFGGKGFLTDAQFEATSDPLGQPKAGLSVPLDQLAAYVASLDTVPESPYRYSGRLNRQKRNWGKQIFDRNCAQCHSGPDYTDKQRHDVGTVQPSSGKGINLNLVGVGLDTPTLKGLWNTAPYFHNGQAPRLVDTLRLAAHGNSSSLTSTEREELVHFLLSLDDGPPFIDPTIVDFARIPRGGAERPHVSQLYEGGHVYADSRSVALSDVPDQFVGKTLVSTYWADRRTTGDYLRFTVVSAESGDSVTSQVCVAFDEAAEARPDWLRDWTILPNTSLSVGTSVTGALLTRRFPILCKHFEPGAITLGGNMAPGAQFPVHRAIPYQYLVFVTTG